MLHKDKKLKSLQKNFRLKKCVAVKAVKTKRRLGSILCTRPDRRPDRKKAHNAFTGTTCTSG